MSGRLLESDDALRGLLTAARIIAVVGLSPRSTRPSHTVARVLQRAGYRIVPVNPVGGHILGEPAAPSVTQLPTGVKVDIVNVFRRPEALPALAEELREVSARAVWLQLGVRDAQAESALLDSGFDLVVDRCLAVEYGRLLG